jgi:hypothetical protein
MPIWNFAVMVVCAEGLKFRKLPRPANVRGGDVE